MAQLELGPALLAPAELMGWLGGDFGPERNQAFARMA